MRVVSSKHTIYPLAVNRTLLTYTNTNRTAAYEANISLVGYSPNTI